MLLRAGRVSSRGIGAGRSTLVADLERPALRCRVEDRPRDVDDVARELARRAVWAPLGDRLGEVVRARSRGRPARRATRPARPASPGGRCAGEPARRRRSGREARARPWVPWITKSQTYWPGASKLATRLAVTPLSSCSVAEVWVGVSAREALACTRARSRSRDPRTRVDAKPANPGDRAEQRDERSQVVRAHVEQRAGAVREEDVRVRDARSPGRRRASPRSRRAARRSRLRRAAPSPPGTGCRERRPARRRSGARAAPASATSSRPRRPSSRAASPSRRACRPRARCRVTAA